jgi:hypothetical protein
MSDSESATKPHKPPKIHLLVRDGRFYARYMRGPKERRTGLGTSDLNVARERLEEFAAGINARRETRA